MSAIEATSEDRPDVLPLQAIVLSPEERASGQLAPRNLDLAAALLSCRGYVILRNALEAEFVQALAGEMDAIYEDCRRTLHSETGTAPDSQFQTTVSAQKEATFWFRKSRWRIFPRLTGSFGDVRLLGNPFVVPILERLLGEDYYCKYVSSDTCVKGAMLQSPHSDIDGDDMIANDRWQPRGYVVNVPTMVCDLHNGPIEVWPGGSHMWNDELMQTLGLEPNVQDGRNPPVEALAQYLPSIKLSLYPGEILIRDLAMWHRGTPNPTDQPRTMLTMGFFTKEKFYGYGDPSYNVDEDLYRQLPPRVRRMFDYYFTPSAKRRRAQSALKKAAKAWIKSRLGMSA